MISDDIAYWSTTLKSYAANWMCSETQKESFGKEICENCWSNLLLVVELISILDCYSVSSSYNVTAPTVGQPSLIPVPDYCLTDADITKVFSLASHVVNKSGGCSGC